LTRRRTPRTLKFAFLFSSSFFFWKTELQPKDWGKIRENWDKQEEEDADGGGGGEIGSVAHRDMRISRWPKTAKPIYWNMRPLLPKRDIRFPYLIFIPHSAHIFLLRGGGHLENDRKLFSHGIRLKNVFITR
jgi:hypothetical protein